LKSNAKTTRAAAKSIAKTMNPWGQPQQPYNPAMAAYYQQQQAAAAYGQQQQAAYYGQPPPPPPQIYAAPPAAPQMYAQPPMPHPGYPYAQPGYAYPPQQQMPQQMYGAAPQYYPQPVAPPPVAAPPVMQAVQAPPSTTVDLPEGAKAPMNVFVGKLPLDVHDSCVEALLKQCGAVLKWKRTVDGETNKAKAFGFCTFGDAQGALSAVELLNDFDLKGQKILVKVGKKEQAVIDDLVTKRRALTSSTTQTYAAVPSGSVQRTPQDEEKLKRLRTFITTVDTTQPISATALATLGGTDAPLPGSKEQMIAEEMAKFRSKQAQRGKELEDERRQKLQDKVKEAQLLEKTIGASLDSAKKRVLSQREGAAKRPKVEAAPAATALDATAPKLGFSFGGAVAQPKGFRPGLASTSAFGAEEKVAPRELKTLDDDEASTPAFIPPPPVDSSARAATDDDAKKRDRAIAEAIPTDADKLFAANVDWAAVRERRPRFSPRPWSHCTRRWSARASSRRNCGRGCRRKSPSIWERRSLH